MPPTVAGVVTDRSGNTVPWSAAWSVDQAPPVDIDWEAMRDEVLASRSMAAADAWYAAHTGIGSPDPVAMPAGYTDPGPLTPSQLVNGSLQSTHDGQVFIGIRGNNISMRHNNLTYVRCEATGLGGSYGCAYSPTNGSGLGGNRLEACNIIYPLQVGEPGYTTKDPAWFNGRGLPNGAQYATIMRRCDISGWAGGTAGFNVLLEYNWHHNPQYANSVHINQWRLRTEGRAWRNYGVGGNSGIMSLYFDTVPVHNVSYEENFLNGALRGSTVLPNFLVNMKNGPYVQTATGIVVRNNYFGPMKQSGNMTTEDVRWGQDGNVLGPNFDVARGTTF